MNVLPACLLCTTCMSGAKGESDPSEVELQTAVGAENQTRGAEDPLEDEPVISITEPSLQTVFPYLENNSHRIKETPNPCSNSEMI